MLGLAGGVWMAGCVYGLLTVPVRSAEQCIFYPDADALTRQLLILEFVLAAALALAIVATERARQPSDPTDAPGFRPFLRPVRSVGIVWLLFGLIALQDTGIAPFLGYIDDRMLPETRMLALLAMWAATIAFGAAAVVHTLVVAGADLRARSKQVVPVRLRQASPALMTGLFIGIALTVPVCWFDWNNPTMMCIV
ncbi:hypothetical protein ACIRRA_45440 [Nocardia sp. NPDC101769]|uniref:hypothetical protein n=1 Tax=Nocardia sp. NPDC101769 TaxID=3364333 RepID=UPI0037F7D99D